MPVAYQIAQALQTDLDVFIVRKLGLPGQEELAIGAIASGGVRVLNWQLIDEVQLASSIIEGITAREQMELTRREQLYRQGRPPVEARDQTVVIVDDGLATGATMKAACQALRSHKPKKIVVAVPVAASETCDDLRSAADEIICAYTPVPFSAVGVWYANFATTTDEEVQQLLKLAEQTR